VHPPIRRLFLLPALIIAVLVGACDSTVEALPRLDDPDEILEEALRTTAELEFVQARLELRASAPEAGAAQVAYTVAAEIDLDRREFHAAVDGSLGIGETQQVELLLVGTDLFTRFQGLSGVEESGRWQRTAMGAGEDPRAGIPPNPAIAVALRALLEDDQLATELRGIEDCGDMRCYHVVTTIAPDLIWRAVNGALLGAPPEAEVDPLDPAIPPVAIDILIEESTRRLVSLAGSVTFDGTTVDATLALSNHDVEVHFLPPPPDQVDDLPDGRGLEPSMLDDVGGSIDRN